MSKGNIILVLRRFANGCMLATNVVVAIALVVTAYCGEVSPQDQPLCGVLVLTFPMWLAATVLLFVLDAIWWRRTVIIPIAAVVAAWPMVWNVCPLNIGGGIPSGTPADRVFTLLTYNVMNLEDQTGEYPGDSNPTLRYILDTDADIVCLEELTVFECSPSLHIHQALLDSLHARYPYIVLSGQAMGIFSKYPVTNLHLGMSTDSPDYYCDMAAYTVDVDGRRLAVFSVHLQSYSLNDGDKETYLELTKLKPDEQNVRDLKNTLLHKFKVAAMKRSYQARELARYVDYYGGENVVVCGDFNDVPGCYTLRTLAEHGLREVWPEVAFGPTITFNADRFYFRIDHILWRGNFHPVDIRRGSERRSDHYPLLATFVWNEDE